MGLDADLFVELLELLHPLRPFVIERPSGVEDVAIVGLWLGPARRSACRRSD
jgi:hypothetical protein